MKTKFETVYFTKSYETSQSILWYCHTNTDNLTIGNIKYNNYSKQHIFFPNYNSFYLADDLKDIFYFITQLNNQ